MKECIIGIDIGGTKIAAGITDRKGKLIFRTAIPTFAEKGFKSSIAQVYAAVENVLGSSGKTKKDIAGIGICAPGPLDPDKGIVHNPPNLPGWKNVALTRLIKEKFDIKVKLENDANAAGMAEVLWGAARGYKHVLYVTVSTGIGTAVIIDGKIYHGKNGMAGEGGHATINFDSSKDICNCGNIGCIEAIASGPATSGKFLKTVKASGRKKKMMEYIDPRKGPVTMIEIDKAAKKGNKYAEKAIRQQGEMLGIWLGSMISILDPEIIVIGGGVSNIGEMILSVIRKTIPAHTINMAAARTMVVKAELKNDVGILGAASIMMG
ncbi:MAG: ROK family protein [Candidatus Omnitrophota bacterium]